MSEACCRDCGEPFVGYDCCTNPDCSAGRDNIADIKADREYDRFVDQEVEEHFERLGR